MLNQTTNIKFGSNSQTVQFNAPSSGILQRSHPKSTFVRFQRSSEMEKMIFPSNGNEPYIHKFDWSDDRKIVEDYKNQDRKIIVTVLQILIFGNDYYLVEVVEPKFLFEESNASKQ
jgi:hypothetical protein